MVSESDLLERLHGYLQTSDLDITTTGILRRRLEEDFGVDLSGKKSFIREHVRLYLQGDYDKDRKCDKQGFEEEVKEARLKSAKNDFLDPNELNNVEDEGVGKEEDVEARDVDYVEEDAEFMKSSNGVKKRNGFTKLCSLSPELQEFMGVSENARTQVVKQVWSYIKENNLQDPNDKRNIICDNTLQSLFKVDTINMFKMNKSLAKHIWPLEAEDAPTKCPAKEKQNKRKNLDEGSKQKKKQEKSRNSGFLTSLQLSDALVKFLGTGESVLPRCEVIKKVWAYIKENNLQDPSDKRRILCDERLKELFNVDSFIGFSVSKLLVTHFMKPEQ